MKKDVVVIGAGLTGLTLAYYLKKEGKNVLVIEKSARIGGVIETITEDEFTYECGPSTGVLGSIEIIELFHELASKCKLQIANQDAKKRLIWKKNRWHALPSGLMSAIGTPLFSWYDKFRILGEPFRPKGGSPDESVADMVVRRLGKSFLHYAVDPFISGVYAGDPEKLITRHALPKLYNLENSYGGFVKGTIAIHKGVKPDKPYSHKHKVTREVFSVQGGLKNLIQALATEIGEENIITSCQQAQIKPVASGFTTQFSTLNSELITINSTNVVSTIGGFALRELIPFATDEQLFHLSDTTYAPVIQVAVGYKNWLGIKLDAFGGLISSKANRQILGVLFPSAIFAQRAPENGAMLSVFVGGMRKPELILLSDEEIKKLVLSELEITMKTNAEPDLIRIFRYQHAIAQYDIKSEDRKNTISAIESAYPGLVLAGSIRDGIGMSDRVKQAKSIALKICDL